MGLILEVLGVLVGGLLLARVLLLAGLLSTGPPASPRRSGAGIGVAVALVAGLLFWDHVYQVAGSFPEATRAASEVSPFAAQHAAVHGANNAFLAWARRQMLAGRQERGTYYLEPATILGEATPLQWSTYVLSPERATPRLREADWIVFYGIAPQLTAEQSHQFGEIEEFSPDFALAQRLDAH